MDGIIALQSLTLAFLIAVLGQSGWDKLSRYKDNLDYFKGQFKNSPLAGLTGLLLPVITAMEVGTVLLAVAGFVRIWTGGGAQWGTWAVCLGALNFIALIFGLRISQDYAGAAGVTPYLAATLIGLYSFVAF